MTRPFYGVPGSPEYWEWRREADGHFAQERLRVAVSNQREVEKAARRRQIGSFVLTIGVPIIATLMIAAFL